MFLIIYIMINLKIVFFILKNKKSTDLLYLNKLTRKRVIRSDGAKSNAVTHRNPFSVRSIRYYSYYIVCRLLRIGMWMPTHPGASRYSYMGMARHYSPI